MWRVCFFLCVFLYSFNALAQDKDSLTINEHFLDNSIISFNIKFTGLGIKELGWGFGISWERKITRFNSCNFGFNHKTIWLKKNDINNIVFVGVNLDALFYPLGHGLDKLYVGIGGRTDFLHYNGKNVPIDYQQNSVIYIHPQIGWKQNFQNYVLVDVHIGYSYIINKKEIYPDARYYITQGVEYGLSTHFNLVKIYLWFKQE